MQLTEKQRNELIEIRKTLNEYALKVRDLPEEDLPADHPLTMAAEFFRLGLAQLSLILDKGPDGRDLAVIDCGTF